MANAIHTMDGVIHLSNEATHVQIDVHMNTCMRLSQDGSGALLLV